MKRELLSQVLNGIDERHIASAVRFDPKGIYASLERKEDMVYRHNPKKYTRRRAKVGRIILIAAVIAALGVVTAWAVFSRINMKVIAPEENGSSEYDVFFEPTDEEHIELGYWYPQSLPDGFEVDFVSEHLLDGQRIRFKNAVGDEMSFEYSIARESFGMGIPGDSAVEPVQVNDQVGKRFIRNTVDGNSTVIIWTNSDRGIGFVLEYWGAGEVDLLSIAESVTEQDKGFTPTLSVYYDKALEELGNYVIGALPSGYERTEFIASPTSLGGGYSAYVRQRFENADYAQIYLGYEMIGHPSDPSGYYEEELYGMTDEEIAEMIQEEYTLEKHLFNYRWLTDDYAVTDTTIGGADAAIVERLDGSMPLEVSWYVKGAGPQEGLLFVMWATDLTADELVALAESVTLTE